MGWFKTKSKQELADTTLKKLKLFVSHRYGDDDDFRNAIESRLAQFATVENETMTQDKMLQGPMGGNVSQFKIKQEICSRIRRCDVLVCPNTKAITANDWISWEVELAALIFNKPVIFVDKNLSSQVNTALFSGLREAGVQVAQCGNDGMEMYQTISSLTGREPAAFYGAR